MRYRTKPFEIEAVRFRELSDCYRIKNEVFPDIEFQQDLRGLLVWDYLQLTWVIVNPGDYIIKGMKGEYYPCAPEVFEAKYEVINE